MQSWPESYAKDVLGTILALRGQVIMEYEIVTRRLRADMLFLPESARRGRGDLGIIDRMADLGECLIELFSAPPRSQVGFDCLAKHLSHHGQRCNRARHRRKAQPPRPHLWMISPGRPQSLIDAMPMEPMDGWPPGFWQMPGESNVHLVVVSDLPETPDTLVLRLLGRGKRLQRAMMELDALPQTSRLWRSLVQLMFAWKEKIKETSREETMLLPESKARYAAWEKRVIGEGIKQGKKEGRREGKKEGERRVLRKQLKLRFGELPPDVERRLKRASLTKLELWAERVLTADSLAAVFAD